MTHPEMFESGLQPERTWLAWRRTVIALLVGSVVSYRVLAPAIGWWSVPIGTSGLMVTAVLWILASRRRRALLSGGPQPGGGVLLLLGSAVALAAVIGGIYVVG